MCRSTSVVGGEKVNCHLTQAIVGNMGITNIVGGDFGSASVTSSVKVAVKNIVIDHLTLLQRVRIAK